MSATAAGGRFRSQFGRSLFRTEKVCQSVIQPDIVTNKVCRYHHPWHAFASTDAFRCVKVLVSCILFLHPAPKRHVQVEFSLLGLVPGHVGLRGKLEEVDGNKDTVKVWHQQRKVS